MGLKIKAPSSLSHSKASHAPQFNPIPCMYVTARLGKMEGTIKNNLSDKKISASVSVSIEGELLLPIDQGRNPHIQKVHQENLKWLIQMGFAKQDDKRFKKFQTSEFSALFSTPLRHHSSEDLKLVTNFIAFLFIFDDVVDELKHKGREFHSVMNFFYEILSGKVKEPATIPDYQFPMFKSFCNALFDIRLRIEKLNENFDSKSTDAFDKYFLIELKQYFYSLQWEEKNQAASMPINDYIAMRGHTGAVGVTFEFIAVVMKIYLPAEIRENPIVNRIKEASISALSICNDLVSQQKELKEPNHCTMLTVMLNKILNSQESLLLLLKEKFIKNTIVKRLFQKSIANSFDYHNDEIRSFLTLPSQLPKEIADIFEPYYQILYGCNYDNYNWSVNLTKRYLVNAIEFHCYSEAGSFIITPVHSFLPKIKA